MAILDSPITPEMVKTCKGVLDFYYYNGRPICRKWPRKCKQPGSPLQLAHWARLRAMHALVKESTKQFMDDSWRIGTPSNMSQNDAQRKFAWQVAERFQPKPVPFVHQIYYEEFPAENVTEFVIRMDPAQGEMPDYYIPVAHINEWGLDGIDWKVANQVIKKWCNIHRYYHPVMPAAQETPEQLLFRSDNLFRISVPQIRADWSISIEYQQTKGDHYPVGLVFKPKRS